MTELFPGTGQNAEARCQVVTGNSSPRWRVTWEEQTASPWLGGLPEGQAATINLQCLLLSPISAFVRQPLFKTLYVILSHGPVVNFF